MDEEVTGSEDSGELNFDVNLGGDNSGEQTQQNPDGSNPAWNGLLESIPEPFRKNVMPHLQEWDKGVNARFEKLRTDAVAPFNDYKQFVDNKISAADLQRSYQIMQAIDNSPLEVYNQLQAMLTQAGLLQAQQQEQQIPEGQSEFTDPRVDELMQQQQQFMQQWQAQQQQAQQEAYIQQYAAQQTQQINSELDQIQNAIGGMPEWLRIELIDRASLMTDREHRPVSIIEAFQEFQQVRSNLNQLRPGARAPRVVPSSGGIPQQQIEPQKLDTWESRANAIKAIRDRNS